MLELPEILTVSAQLRAVVTGKTVRRVLPPSKPHKFCWFNGDPEDYDRQLKGSVIVGAEGFGCFAEIVFDNGRRLCFNDGVNARFLPSSSIAGGYQLTVEFADDTALVFTVAMYGGLILHGGDYDNEYYRQSKDAVSPFDAGFADYYRRLLADSKPALGLKAFLATEQRFPGLGNGVLQDILFTAGLNPRRRIDSLGAAESDKLLGAIVGVLGEMTELGGRDTEKDIFGNAGGYRTKMSRNAYGGGCPVCGGAVVKEAYLGGSVYYCPRCQPKK